MSESVLCHDRPKKCRLVSICTKLSEWQSKQAQADANVFVYHEMHEPF